MHKASRKIKGQKSEKGISLIGNFFLRFVAKAAKIIQPHAGASMLCEPVLGACARLTVVARHK